MLALILALAVSNGDIVEHQLRKEVTWQLQQELPNTTLKSYTYLSPRKVRIIQDELETMERKFNQFYGLDCHPGHLEIRVIRLAWLNSSDYFVWVDHRYLVFGRYFGMRNVLYVTPETFADLNTLDHELTHYLYDECNMSFDSDDQEHRKLEAFLRWKNEINLEQ